jgi:hypothetical protein
MSKINARPVSATSLAVSALVKTLGSTLDNGVQVCSENDLALAAGASLLAPWLLEASGMVWGRGASDNWAWAETSATLVGSGACALAHAHRKTDIVVHVLDIDCFPRWLKWPRQLRSRTERGSGITDFRGA